ncbi:DMT family transporter, partial [Sutterella sp.]|uniref:DMT family transporter n=1 Tax=Sutterella sp. TaxID=1981025 RepID=UPI0026DEB982
EGVGGAMSALPVFCGALAVTAVFTLANGAPLPSAEAISASIVPLLFLGFFHTGFAGVLYFESVPKLPASYVSAVSYLEALTAIVAAVLILGESLTIPAVIGAVMLIGGAAAAQMTHGAAHRPAPRRTVQSAQTVQEA